MDRASQKRGNLCLKALGVEAIFDMDQTFHEQVGLFLCLNTE